MKHSISVLMLAFLLLNCKEEIDTTFLITDTKVGVLEKESLARDIDLIYAQDSVVKDTLRLGLGNKAKKIRIYEKGGTHLLTLTPSADSIPTIENVRFEDDRYKTGKGININSTFKDIKDAYTIKKVITSRNNVLVLVKESNVYFTISKEELPSSLRYASSVNIEAVQIPDKAKIKYMMLGWD
ncbi:hypothetical protein FK220_002345 [Flavobacteriaceae bacterium TP-CH-4]|uniref:Uncharacterized protein n=1 Tax=Pelagihabitans pacificus TaxID=2696054 RepID=A0A967AQ58_9FLAO|nr:hypothetical protein [Pelagihabitans pacificus]NHF58164.1 hypothetical protein [Pelagihabitans pacificus]